MKPPKRAFDLVLSGVGLLLVSPVMALIAILIKRDDGGPVFYRPVRVGYRGRPFRQWKFRTMVQGADRSGIGLTVGEDPRVTDTGRVLRHYKLDELPQLLNVVSGEMSLVGPRPEDPRYVAMYTAGQRQVLELVPGMTDPASIRFIDESTELGKAGDPERVYVENIMPRKIAMNLDYAPRANVASDLMVILRSILEAARPPRRVGR